MHRASLFLFVFFLSSTLLIFYALHVPLPSLAYPVLFYSTSNQDDIKLTLIQAIRGATHSISLYSYGISDTDIIRLLKKKAKAGLRIKLFYHQRINRQLEKKIGKEINCYPVLGKGLMHKKILLIDEKQIFFGSANFTGSSLMMHHNSLLGLYSPTLGTALENQLSSHYQCAFPGQILDLFLLPEEKEAALEKLLHTLNHAQKSIAIALFTFTHFPIAKALIAARARGVTVTLFLDSYTIKGSSKKTASLLNQSGIAVYHNYDRPLFHHKWALIDQKKLVLGSANWTEAAFQKNEEFLLFLAPLTKKQCQQINKTLHRFKKQSVSLPKVDEKKMEMISINC